MRHVGGDPVALDGEGGEHGGPLGGRDLEDMGGDDVPGADELDGGDCEPDGVAHEVGDDHAGGMGGEWRWVRLS